MPEEPESGESGGNIFSGLPALSSDLAQLIVQVVIILVTTRGFVLALRFLKQPAVISEIVAGIALGPSVLGHIPGFTTAIFPADSLAVLQLFASIGCVTIA